MEIVPFHVGTHVLNSWQKERLFLLVRLPIVNSKVSPQHDQGAIRVHRGKCPKCSSLVTAVNVDNVDIIGASSSCNGVAYLCPHCDTVLGVSMDQLALNAVVVRNS